MNYVMLAIIELLMNGLVYMVPKISGLPPNPWYLYVAMSIAGFFGWAIVTGMIGGCQKVD